MMFVKLILGLSLIVFIHELGHFLAARIFGVKVDKFYLFFDFGGKSIFKINIKGTEYGIGWFPLGGYVKLSGMVDESMDISNLSDKPQDFEFRSKPAWQRLIILSAGVIFNIILGISIMSYLALKEDYIPNNELKNGVYAYTSGISVGFKSGDKILELNDNIVENYSLITPLSFYKGKFLIERNGEKIYIDLTNKVTLTDALTTRYISPMNFPPLIDSIQANSIANKIKLQPNDLIIKLDTIIITSVAQFQNELARVTSNAPIYLEVNRDGSPQSFYLDLKNEDYLGVFFHNPIVFKNYSVLSAIEKGWKSSYEILYTNIIGLKMMITGQISSKGITGPIGIAKIYGDDYNINRFLSITAMLSLVIGFMNILPIPALDGGHILIILFETITRRKISDKILGIIQILGIIVILGLMIFAFYNDIMNLIS